ncbi:MAG: ester cyclase [Alphaproteobacteria bacterium]
MPKPKPILIACALVLTAGASSAVACQGGPEANKRVVAEAIARVWNAGDTAAIDRLFAPDYVDHSADPLLPDGPDGVRIVYTAMRAAFPDLQMAIQDQIADGELVATRVVLYGTNSGPFMGSAPTGNPVLIPAMHFDRVCDGRIAEHWAVIDTAALAAQLDTDSAVAD